MRWRRKTAPRPKWNPQPGEMVWYEFALCWHRGEYVGSHHDAPIVRHRFSAGSSALMTRSKVYPSTHLAATAEGRIQLDDGRLVPPRA